jgi:hypothetical protein
MVGLDVDISGIKTEEELEARIKEAAKRYK